MVKALTFKGDKKVKKRKRTVPEDDVTNDRDVKAISDDADDSWVSADGVGDVAGPIIFILPTTPLTCIATDTNGKIFISEIENIIDNNPSTAEPHDVRQVWVANRVAGTENFSFKGHHGRYLGCDKFGTLGATKEAISPEESFLCIPVPDTPSTFSVETLRDTFLTVDETKTPTELRGDADSINFFTTFRIRMQARFKPRLRESKEEKAREKISRSELEQVVGRRLEDDEVKKLKKARREGNYHEAILDVKVKGKHDKFA